MLAKITDFFDRERSLKFDLLLLALCLMAASGTSLATSLVADDLILVRNATDAAWSFSELSRAFHMGLEDLSDGWVPPDIDEYRLFFFRPLYMAMLKADIALWGQWMPGYHVTNLILQLLVVYLIYFWARDFSLDRRSSFMAALLFMLFVPNWMAVSWIAGRTELLSAVFILGSIFFMGRYFKSGRPVFYAVSYTAYIGALASKENAIIIPALLAVAGLFLYGPEASTIPTYIRKRLVPLIPFVLMWPFYLGLRYWALGGFPVPIGRFYYHSVSDPDFPRFILTKLHHAIVGLTFQLPALVVPQVLERSLPVLVIMVALSVVIVILFLRWQKGPLRYFFLAWFAITLSPTLLIGFNPIYYYLSSTVMGIVYIRLYRSLSNSPVPWRRKTSRAVLRVFIVFAFIGCAAAGPQFGNTGVLSRELSGSIISALEEHPEARSVYLLEATAGCLFLVPEIRLASSKLDDIKFIHLNMSSDMIFPIASRINQLDDHSFEMRPSQGTYFTTGLEQVALGRDTFDFTPGIAVRHPDYQIEIMEVVPNFERRNENFVVIALRNHFGLPGREQMGVTALRYQFAKPLDSDKHIFLRIVDGGTEQVEFVARGELPNKDAAPAIPVNAKTAGQD